ncbi:Pantoate--beta-alanine ligase [Chitinispirillum alkaliphilum]|nr:Pantoate--beta-alanine ligase [Chitinispirillum alkaliphilum]
MKTVSSPQEMKNLSFTLQKSGSTIGLVPTMGALHKGHLSLLSLASQQTDVKVMSIFVNPTQFAPGEDLEKYPRTLEDDIRRAENAGCDILFVPSVSDMYPVNYSTFVDVENIGQRLCGASRPGHFRGVATVVLKFFNIVNPQVAVFGQKDAQQVIVLKRMVHDLNLSVHIETGPIIRENDGLALSSRNVYLTNSERREASLIYKGLIKAQAAFHSGTVDTSQLRSLILELYEGALYLTPEYIEIVDTLTLEPLERILDTALVAVACRTKQSDTRLIDNIILGGKL